MIPNPPPTVQASVPELRELPADLEPSASISRMLRMSLATFHNHRQAAVDPLPAYRLGNRWFASRREVLAWVERRSRPYRGPASVVDVPLASATV
ncbi:helix-turn-helix domain-containing protein [Paludisphaera sp.]|uniref:helix-turn-helix domain-containing protein n=1 Tax=Paludisphaera sp. TaxID=2017432 RepID=UPI00301C536B